MREHGHHLARLYEQDAMQSVPHFMLACALQHTC